MQKGLRDEGNCLRGARGHRRPEVHGRAGAEDLAERGAHQGEASGCNYNDIWARRGLPGVTIVMPHISGSDAAGEVVEVGSEVTNVKVGDEVVVFSSFSCGIVRCLRPRRRLLLSPVQDMGLSDGSAGRRAR